MAKKATARKSTGKSTRKATTKPKAQARTTTKPKSIRAKTPRRSTASKPPTKPASPVGVLGVEEAPSTPAHFQADVNGFGFVNNWSFTPAETKRVRKALADSETLLTLDPLLTPSLLVAGVPQLLGNIASKSIPQNYGLCGGMAFSALDYYLAGLPIPPGTQQPTFDDANGNKLRNYLVKRQIDSLTLNLPTILLWISMLHFVPSTPFLQTGAPWLLEQTKKQLTTLKQNLDNGTPTPLALIGTNPDPTENHQVLAYNYHQTGPNQVTLDVYDMNCPGTAQTIQLDLSGPALVAQESCANPIRGPLMGFIAETYKPAKPPAMSGFG